MGRLRLAAIAVLLLTASLAGCTGLSPPLADSSDNETRTPEGPSNDKTIEDSDDGLRTSTAGTLEVHYIAVEVFQAGIVDDGRHDLVRIVYGGNPDHSRHVQTGADSDGYDNQHV